MFGAVIITFTVTSLFMLVLFLYSTMKTQNTENERLQKNNEHLSNQISAMIRKDYDRRECLAYNRGLYDARETDTLYRKMLNKYLAGEQATVMMYGEESHRER